MALSPAPSGMAPSPGVPARSASPPRSHAPRRPPRGARGAAQGRSSWRSARRSWRRAADARTRSASRRSSRCPAPRSNAFVRRSPAPRGTSPHQNPRRSAPEHDASASRILARLTPLGARAHAQRACGAAREALGGAGAGPCAPAPPRCAAPRALSPQRLPPLSAAPHAVCSVHLQRRRPAGATVPFRARCLNGSNARGFCGFRRATYRTLCAQLLRSDARITDPPAPLCAQLSTARGERDERARAVAVAKQQLAQAEAVRAPPAAPLTPFPVGAVGAISRALQHGGQCARRPAVAPWSDQDRSSRAASRAQQHGRGSTGGGEGGSRPRSAAGG